ncbi:MAG TPA: PIN domain-containing protein [Candidatus Nanoarchaeia archaeon]|nr:PIN domain-containing protein [Candidatus Nanoarchaeia archaeon]
MIADTSFLVALFIEEDELHEKSINELEKNKKEILITDRILEETFTVICYKKGVDYALMIFEKLKNNKDIIFYQLSEEEIKKIYEIIKKFRKKLSFADYTVIYLALKDNEKILCFDEELNKTINYRRRIQD